jgi:uncharacterized membrane protein (DUF106 family)
MDDDEIKKEVKKIKQMEREILDDYQKLDKSYSRNMIFELIFFFIVIVFLLLFLFGIY